MGRLRIVNIVTQMEGGGAQRCAVLLARYLNDNGHDAETWFLFRRRGVYDDEPAARCILPHPPRTPFHYVLIFVRLFMALRKHSPDALVTFSHYGNLVGCLFGALAGVPVRIARKDGLPQHTPRFARVADVFVGILGGYSSVLANSKTTRDAFDGYPRTYKRRISVVYNGIEVPAPSLSRAEARRLHDLPPEAFVVACVGRAAPVKNFHRLIQAMKSTAGDVHLLVAGDGPEMPTLLAELTALGLTNRVRLLGDLPPESVSNVLIAADMYIQPSLWEAFGLAPLEAASCNLPVAVSAIPAMHEIFGSIEDMNALFFDPTDIGAIATAIARIRSDAVLRRTVAAKSADIAAAYPISSMADGILHTIRNVHIERPSAAKGEG